MEGTLLLVGSFVSTGADKVLDLPSSADLVYVYNRTVATNAQTTAVAVKHMWMRQYPAGAKWSMFKANAANSANLDQYLTSSGFTLVDSSVQTPGLLNATVTAVSNAAIPVVSNSGTNGLAAGDIVQMVNVSGAQQLGNMHFTVGYNTLTSGTFSLDYMSQIVAGTTGSWRKIYFDPIFYPRRRTITKITQATQAVVTLSVTHGYQVGQVVRFVIPEAFGMTELNGLQATITAVNTTTTSGNTITIDVDSSSFTAFAFPLTGDVPFSLAEVVPVGENTAAALAANVNILSDATVNTAYIGLRLAGGINNPAGAASDIIDVAVFKATSTIS